MSNLIHVSQRSTAGRTEETLHLLRVIYVVFSFNVAYRPSRERKSGTPHETNRERVSSYLSVRIHVSVSTNTDTSQNKHGPRRSD